MNKTGFEEARSNLLAGDYRDHWRTKYTFQKIRGSVNKAPLVFQTLSNIFDPDDIPVDSDELGFIAEPFLTSNTFPAGCGFKTSTSFYDWCSNFRSFCDVASGRRGAIRALGAREDDWSKLIAYLSGKYNSALSLNNVEILPIIVLARECRRKGISVRELGPELIAELCGDLSSGVKDAIKKACVMLDGFLEGNALPSELLPLAPIGILPPLTPPDIRTVPPINPAYAALMGEFVENARHGRGIAKFGTQIRPITRKGASASRAKNIGVALRWFWHGLVELKICSLTHFDGVASLIEPIVLHDVTKACEGGMLGPVCDSETRQARVRDVISFLDWLEPGYAASFDRRFFKDKALSKDPKRQSPDRQRKQRACLAFIHDQDIQKRFLTMPRVFFDEARVLISQFKVEDRDDRNLLSALEHRALDLAIMAALTAIVTRFPARLNTVAQLESSGRMRHLFFPETFPNEKDLMLNIPGYIVKNGRYFAGIPLSPSELVDPREIIRWYLAHAHPLILKHKVGRNELRRPHRLFAGLHIETIRKIWRRYVAEVSLDGTVHMCRHFLASLLYFKGVKPEIIAELLGDKKGTSMKFYTFIDHHRNLQQVMEDQAAIYRELGV